MLKFTNIKPKSENTKEDKNTVYSDNHISLVKYEDWTILKEPDLVTCIIYLIDLNQIILRWEYVPTYKFRDSQEYHIVTICGSIKKGETPEKALLREIEEEAGIVISPNYNIEFMKPLFVSKGNSSKYYPAIISLTERDYQEVIAKGDGSKIENMSKSVKIDVKFIKTIQTSDLITEYMLDKIKEFLNIKV